MDALDLALFEQVGEVTRMLASGEVGPVQFRWHRRGVKVWCGDGDCPREHYEAQLIRRADVDGITGAALEIGFHSEHRDVARNEAVLSALTAAGPGWHDELGPEATAGAFFGSDVWRRVSEVWVEPDLEDDEVGFEIGARLADYVLALEPLVSPLRS